MTILSLIALAIFLLILTYKNIPFMWLIRNLQVLILRRYLSPIHRTQLTPECLFLPTIHRSRSPLTECDHNMHKSNSTYFSDLNISHGNIGLTLFNQFLALRPGAGSAFPALGGVQCVFHREIKPYQAYEVWSRVLSWDEKWIYIVSHFVEPGAFRPRRFFFQRKYIYLRSRCSSTERKNPIFASSIARFVLKQGRKTVPPEIMLVQCGLLPGKEASSRADLVVRQVIEERRRRDLETAQLRLGWDAVREAFEGEGVTVLSRYTDLI
ncbi:hypothetical protein P175DRAFT_0487157 [Aspergillus ochraceoroseus IBT 24754]|uniref:Thioesterase domain-containing protein n=1 Tax=Aspergillus ochraceoroseus IBT 24754 TaxID=1392256 RepID=A0A2T5LMP0_9EURO|nr:uncharacterized protein P175DRAFT_0487157 [Aspergillus ochraceoroseus IBT 24754]PTU17537.1 hypothetical protein P175DRAFT_0487157 [Aspergillus ochraceoroseus IBT 24754]